MAFTAWLEVALVCSLGAMSPGPSLGVVIRNTIAGGKSRGVACGIGHGIGFTIYAGIAVAGLGYLIKTNSAAFEILQFFGVFFLAFVAIQMLQASRNEGEIEIHISGDKRGFVEGFLIAFLNPKIFAFLIAVFSQFISTDLIWGEKLGITLMAGIIDGGWYIFVATILAGTPLLEQLQKQRHRVDLIIGTILLLTAVGLFVMMF